MYSQLQEILTRALETIYQSPKSELIQRKSRRHDAQQLLALVEFLENAHVAASKLANSAMYYRQHDWKSLVAKRMRKGILCGESTTLAKSLSAISSPLHSILDRARSKHCHPDLTHYLMGVKVMRIGRGHKYGAPTLSPILQLEKADDKNSCLMITYVSKRVSARQFSEEDLQKYMNGNYSPFPFLKTIKLNSEEAEPIIAEAISTLPALEKLCHDYREWFRQSVTIDDLIAEVVK
jgi:hypothetical protein